MTNAQHLVQNNELVGEIHDRLLDDNKLDLAEAYNDACAWIAELYTQIECLEKVTSAGFLRKKSS